MKLIKKNNKKGFTLVELVIVIAILAILALILVPAIGKYISNADKAKNEASARTLYTSAITELASDKTLTETTLPGKAMATANMKTGTVTVVINDSTKQVTSITYTPVGGKAITFDGSVFTESEATETP